MTSEAVHYRLVLPFMIDNGELDGLTLTAAFVLGFEFACVREILNRDLGFVSTLIHHQNAPRVLSMCFRMKRQARVLPPEDGWATLEVEPHR